MKCALTFLLMVISMNSFSQNKDSLLKNDIHEIVELLEFMFDYDQMLRKYLQYKTLDISETKRIENLPDSLIRIEMQDRRFVSDTLKTFIGKNYINPLDSLHTEILIDLTRKYGYLSNKRIREYYENEFSNPNFNVFILLNHSPEFYWKDIEILIENELENGRLNRCTYGWIKWHVNGRNDMNYFFDNGWEVVEENGRQRFIPVDCD